MLNETARKVLELALERNIEERDSIRFALDNTESQLIVLRGHLREAEDKIAEVRAALK